MVFPVLTEMLVIECHFFWSTLILETCNTVCNAERYLLNPIPLSALSSSRVHTYCKHIYHIYGSDAVSLRMKKEFYRLSTLKYLCLPPTLVPIAVVQVMNRPVYRTIVRYS